MFISLEIIDLCSTDQFSMVVSFMSTDWKGVFKLANIP